MTVDQTKPTWHLNLKWTLADMKRLSDLVKAKRTIEDIAFMFGVHPQEVREVINRNHNTIGWGR